RSPTGSGFSRGPWLAPLKLVFFSSDGSDYDCPPNVAKEPQRLVLKTSLIAPNAECVVASFIVVFMVKDDGIDMLHWKSTTYKLQQDTRPRGSMRDTTHYTFIRESNFILRNNLPVNTRVFDIMRKWEMYKKDVAFF
ncbi:Protein of unknown function, partial [Gryllus bimaculatus]